MASITLTWDLPTAREDNRPLSRAEIAGVVVEMSADGGQNYVEMAFVNGVEFIQNELDPGTYHFRLTVVDRQAPAKRSLPAPAFGTIFLGRPLSVTNVVVTVA